MQQELYKEGFKVQDNKARKVCVGFHAFSILMFCDLTSAERILNLPSAVSSLEAYFLSLFSF